MLTPKELERYSRQIQPPGLGAEEQKALKNPTAQVSGVGGLGDTVSLYSPIAGIGNMLTPKELERYSRQIQLPGLGVEGQKALKNSTALVSGVGGLGGTVALYLAVAGIGKLILVRGGGLRLDDMNRQILMTDDWVGKSRVIKAKETLSQINPDVEVEAIAEYITADNVDALVQRSDIALSCAHNFPERDLLNTACVRWNKPMVEAAMNSMEAYLTTIVPDKTPCLSCLFPEKPDWDRRAFGVLGAVSGTLACLSALEAIKLITGLGKPLLGQLLNMDLANLEFNKLRLYKDPDCPVCGKASREVREFLNKCMNLNCKHRSLSCYPCSLY